MQTCSNGVTVDQNAYGTHRVVVASWHDLILAMLMYSFFAWRDSDSTHWLWIPLFLTPLLALAASFATISSRNRSLAYWMLALISIPTSAAGLTTIIGWLFLVAIVLLIWAARREKPGEELVQM